MDLARVVQLVSASVFLLAGVVKALDARPAGHSPSRDRLLATTLSLGLVLVAAGQFLSLPTVVGALDGTTAVGTTKVAYNALVVLGLLGILCFFKATAASTGRLVEAVRFDLAAGVAVVVALAVLMAATEQHERSASVPNPGASATVFLFYVVGNTWFLYAYLRCFLYALRYARRSHGSLAAACAVVALGLFASALTSVLRLGIVGVRQLGVPESRIDLLNSVNFASNSAGLLLVTVGIVVLGWARLARWRHRRRLYARLEPLYLRLSQSISDLVAPAPPAAPGAALGSRPAFNRLYLARIVQCWDGIMRLAPALNEVVGGRRADEVEVAELAIAIVAATSVRPPVGSERAEAASPHLLAVLVREGDEGSETGSRVLADVSDEVGRIVQACGDQSVQESAK